MQEPRRYAAHHIGALAMHHIYCPSKKERIHRFAAADGVTGLYLYGKPGRIVVECGADRLARYDRRVRSMHWSKYKLLGRVVRVVDAAVPRAASPEEAALVATAVTVLDDGAAADARLFDTFAEVESEAEMEAELRRRGLGAVWDVINRDFASRFDPRHFGDTATTQ
jgi:hypothetical protein